MTVTTHDGPTGRLLDQPPTGAPGSGGPVGRAALHRRRASWWTTDAWIVFGQIAVILYCVANFGVIFEFLLIPTKMGVAIILLFTGLSYAFSPHGTVGKTVISIPVVLLLVWWIVSCLWTPDMGVWVAMTLSQLSGVVLLVFASVLPIQRFMDSIIATVYIALVASTIAFIVQPARAMTHLDPVTGVELLPGWHGSFVHKNEMVPFVVLGAITMLLYQKKGKIRTIALAYIALLVVMAQSATGLSLVAALLFFGWWLNKYLRQTQRMRGSFVMISSLLGVMMVGLLIVATPLIVGAYGKDLTFSGRTKIWAAVLDAIAAKPWTGYSPNGVWLDFTASPTSDIFSKIGFPASHAHNGALEFLLKLGIVGLVLLLLVLVATMQGGWRLLRNDPALGRWSLLLCALIIVQDISEIAVVGAWLAILCAARVLTIRRSRELRAESRARARTAAAQVARATA